MTKRPYFSNSLDFYRMLLLLHLLSSSFLLANFWGDLLHPPQNGFGHVALSSLSGHLFVVLLLYWLLFRLPCPFPCSFYAPLCLSALVPVVLACLVHVLCKTGYDHHLNHPTIQEVVIIDTWTQNIPCGSRVMSMFAKRKELIRFWWPWPDYQDHQPIKTVKICLFCTISTEPVDGFYQTFIDTLLVGGNKLIIFWWSWPNFQGHQPCKDLTSGHFLRHNSWTSGWIFTKLSKIHCQEFAKSLLEFGGLDIILRSQWPFLIFKILFPDLIFWTTGQIWIKLAKKNCLEGGKSWLDRFLSNMHRKATYMLLGDSKELIRFWLPWPNFFMSWTIWWNLNKIYL